VLPTLRDESLAQATSALPARPPTSLRARARGNVLPALLGALLLVTALVTGFVSGRFTSRPRGSSFAITGSLPRRTEVFLDGKKLTIADGVPMQVPPGAHTVSLVSKATKRDIPFSVRAGEHVVILAPPRASAAPGAPASDDDGP